MTPAEHLRADLIALAERHDLLAVALVSLPRTDDESGLRSPAATVAERWGLGPERQEALAREMVAVFEAWLHECGVR